MHLLWIRAVSNSMPFHFFASFQDAYRKSAKTEHRVDCAILANPDVVPTSSTTPVRPALGSVSSSRTSKAPIPKRAAPFTQKTPPNGMFCVGILRPVQTFRRSYRYCHSSCRRGINKQYAAYITKWLTFCNERKIDCYSPPAFNQGLLCL